MKILNWLFNRKCFRKAKESANLSAYFLARGDERKGNFAYKIANAWVKLMRKQPSKYKI